MFLMCSREKESKRARAAGLVVTRLCGCVLCREPDYHQSSWNSSLISARQGPVLGTVDELALGTGLPGDKHCCLCYALLNNSISMVLRSAVRWLAPNQPAAVFLWFLCIGTVLTLRQHSVLCYMSLHDLEKLEVT